ncbi:hypothetical protein AGMMS50268_40990 [Spirochaetia bacterium]|nr:hypothetical protein AGMMS50268_40990 [Spirochaetia bacterium]
MAAAVILGTVFSLISLRFRHRNGVTIILSMTAVIAIMAWSFNLRFTTNEEIISFVTNLENRIFRFYPPAVLYERAITAGIHTSATGIHTVAAGRGLSFFLFAFLSLGPPALFTAALAKWYGKINSAMAAVKAGGVYHPENSRGAHVRSPFYALYVRELRRFVASPVYILNTGIGAVLLIMAAVSLLFTDVASFESSFGIPGLLSGGSFAVPFFPAIFAALSPSTAAGISLEGKSRWLISSLPVKTGMLFAVKIALNLSFTVPAVLIAAPLFAHALSLAGVSRLFIFVTPLGYSFLTAVLGLGINLRFPKYDWTTEQQAVKQSASVVLTMLAGLAAVFIPMALVFIFPRYGAQILAAVTLSAAAAAFLLYRKISRRRYYGFT